MDNPAIVSKFPNGARQFSLELSRDSNNHARYRALIYIGESGVFSNEYIAFNAWNHIAIVGTASDTTARIYTNGIRNSNTISILIMYPQEALILYELGHVIAEVPFTMRVISVTLDC